tara:strand:+ start:323 stop:559 length:237 start_codon:yes stop_codon:yes gene_type:complete
VVDIPACDPDVRIPGKTSHGDCLLRATNRWYASHILAFFETGDRAIVELPIRATFFILMGSLAAVFGGSLRKQGSADH